MVRLLNTPEHEILLSTNVFDIICFSDIFLKNESRFSFSSNINLYITALKQLSRVIIYNLHAINMDFEDIFIKYL